VELPSAELLSAGLLSAGQRDRVPERRFFSVVVALSLSLLVVPGLAIEFVETALSLAPLCEQGATTIAIVSKPAVKSITLVPSSR
jgi:hypothetical protein